MMVSVVVPVYNVAQYVWDCLWSVGQQDYTDIECLIIDDHSTDNSMGVVCEFVEQYHGNVAFRIISQPVNRGLSEARNKGIENAKGEFIYFLDGDDELSPDCISSMVRTQKLKSVDVVVGSHKYVGLDGSVICNIAKTHGNIFLSSDKYWPAFACNKLLSLSYLNQHNIRFVPDIYHEDVLWTYHLLSHSPSIAFSPNITYVYKERVLSIMNKRDDVTLDNRFESYKSILEMMITNVPIEYNMRIGALFFIERTARMMSCQMLAVQRKEEAYWLFDFAYNKVKIPFGYLVSFSDVLIKDRLKLLYVFLPQKLSFSIFLWFYSHQRKCPEK